MKGKKKWVLALIVLLSLAGGAGAYYAFRTDPKVAKVLDLGKQMEGLPREERGKLFGQMREAMEDLTPDQRDQIRRQMFNRNDWMAREQKRMDEFFALSKKEQIKSLDKQIDDMVKAQKEREKRRKEREKERQQTAQAGGQGGGQNGAGNSQGGRGGGPGGGGTGDRGQDRRLAMDNSSARQQAQGSEYRRMMQDRMAQRGIPMTGGGGGFGGFGGGRGGPGGGRGGR